MVGHLGMSRRKSLHSRNFRHSVRVPIFSPVQLSLQITVQAVFFVYSTLKVLLPRVISVAAVGSEGVQTGCGEAEDAGGLTPAKDDNEVHALF